MIARHTLFAFAFLSLMLSPFALAQTVSFTSDLITNTGLKLAHDGDFNNDGREDLITDCGQQVAVSLSEGDGVYGLPVCYPLPSGAVDDYIVGDFNNDGSLDLVMVNGTNVFYEYLNDGTGEFHVHSKFAAKAPVFTITAADMNHDGKIDLALAGSANKVYVYFGNGKGSFSAGPVTAMSFKSSLDIGDFDGDGNADLLGQSNGFQIAYGDGHGHFQTTPGQGSDIIYKPYDINGDGKTDLIGVPFDFSINGNLYYNFISALYGQSNRTFAFQNIQLAQYDTGDLPPAVADLNGDGINDIVVTEASDFHGSPPFTVDVLLGKGDGTYQPEQAVYSYSDIHTFDNDFINGPAYVGILRLNHDTKPDFYIAGLTESHQDIIVFFRNTTPGNFPACAAPDKAVGFNLCSPTSTVSSTTSVKFSIGAGNQTPGRKVEVWIDGKKTVENLKEFSNYSFLDKTLTLAPGTHHVGIFSSGWDNLTQQYDWTGGPGVTFPLTVKSTKCSVNPGLMVCSPLNNSTLGSSVHAWAAGKLNGTNVVRMEVWVDGVKKFTSRNSNTLDTHLSLEPGLHKFTYFLVGNNGTKNSATVTATVK